MTSVAIALGMSLWLLPVCALAVIPLPFSTTYDCPEQDQRSQGWTSCDGLGKYGDWTTPQGAVEQITTLANYPGGGGGRGQRHWIGDGVNRASGYIGYTFPHLVKEVFIRWYVRWQKGLGLGLRGGSHKILYFSGNGCGHTGGCYFDLQPRTSRTVVAGRPYIGGEVGWGALHKGLFSTGEWFCLEAHVKSESAPDATDGVAQLWVNGPLRHAVRNVYFNNFSTGFRAFQLPSNGVFATVDGLDMFNDLDDVAVSISGRIGCIAHTAPRGETR